jgi:hypothetical protein
MLFQHKVQIIPPEQLLTGGLFFRETGATPRGVDKTIWAVVGVIGIPKDFPILNEHQYQIAGYHSPEEKGIIIGVDPTTLIDREEMARGMGAGHLLTMPIWRV